jgi:serine/threonine protein kinase
MAVKKVNKELNQSVEKPITIVGAYISTQLFTEIVNAVHYLHTQKPKILHRDLKPENIFITDGCNGNFIKIGDFGCATIHGSSDDSDSASNMGKSKGMVIVLIKVNLIIISK